MPRVQAATSPDEILADPVLEERARALSRQLRCLVCQNQSIDDSDADLARDLRQLVRERLVAGDSDAEIIAFLTARYGDFVLLEAAGRSPPPGACGSGLWRCCWSPAAASWSSFAGAARAIPRARRSAPKERARLDALMREASDRS